MAKNNIIEAKPNTIVSGTTIKGEITTNGDFRIDGKLIGSIICKGKIVVGQTGSIEGEIECQNADFSGNISAQVKVEQLLTLKTSARLKGDVVTSKLSIEPGAMFTGSCKMDGDSLKQTTLNATQGQQPQQQEKAIK